MQVSLPVKEIPTTASHVEDRIETYVEDKGNHIEGKSENYVEDVEQNTTDYRDSLSKDGGWAQFLVLVQ